MYDILKRYVTHGGPVGGSCDLSHIIVNSALVIDRRSDSAWPESINAKLVLVDAEISEDLRIAAIRFTEGAVIRNCQFRKNFSLVQCGIGKSTVVSNTEFDGLADFSFATVDHFEMIDTTVRASINCLDTSFRSDAKIKNCRFDGAVDFRSTQSSTVCRELRIDRSVFLNTVDFGGRVFHQPIHFSRTVFRVAPRFFRTKSEEFISFAACRFEDRSSEALHCYRKLKEMMEAQRSRDEEGMFAALEQGCKRRHPDTPPLVRGFSWLYGFTSDYGLSPGWPICWLVVVTFIFGLGYHLFAQSMTVGVTFDDADLINETIRFTFRQLVRPFAAAADLPKSTEVNASLYASPPLWLTFVAAIQSTIDLALVGLFALAVRWRFKRD